MIAQIRLRNFRRYVDETLHLKPGVNFIEGRNNAGKTSVFYAIQYALFGRAGGLLPRDLFHPKTREMGVELVFTGKDKQRYRLQRLHMRPARSKTKVEGHFTLKRLDTEGEGEHYLLASDFQDTETQLAQQLAEILGFSRRSFEVAVHLKQGEIAAILAGSKELDIVLGVTAAVASNALMRELALEREKEAAPLAVLREGLDGLLERRTGLTKRLEGLREQAARDEAQRLALGEKIAAEAEPGPIDAACAGLSQALEGLAEAGSEQIRAREAVESLGASRETLQEQIAGLEAARGSRQTDLQTLDTELEALEGKRQLGNQEHGDISGRLKRRQDLPADEGAICDQCGQQIDKHLVSVEIPVLVEELARADAELAELEAQIQDRRERRTTLKDADVAAQLELAEQRDLLGRLDEATAVLSEAEKSTQNRQSEVAAAASSLEAVSPLELPSDPAEMCRIQSEALAAASRQAELDRVRAQTELEGVTQNLERLAEEQQESQSELDEVEKERADKEVKIEELREAEATAIRLRVLAQAFKELQESLRDRATGQLAERTRAIHSELCAEAGQIVGLRIDPKRYAVLVKPDDVGTEVPAHLYQGGGHRLLLGLAFKLAVAELLGPCPFLLLDEPTYGLDPQNRAALLDRICSLEVSDQILLITHQEVGQTAGHHMRILRQGKLSVQEAR